MVNTAKNGNTETDLPEIGTEEKAFLEASPAEKTQLLQAMIMSAIQEYTDETELSISGWWRLYKRQMEAIGTVRSEDGRGFGPRFPIANISSRVLETHFGEKAATKLPTNEDGIPLGADELVSRLSKALRTSDAEQMPLALIALGSDPDKLLEAYRQVFRGSKGFDENSRVRLTTAKAKLFDVISHIAHGTEDLPVFQPEEAERPRVAAGASKKQKTSSRKR